VKGTPGQLKKIQVPQTFNELKENKQKHRQQVRFSLVLNVSYKRSARERDRERKQGHISTIFPRPQNKQNIPTSDPISGIHSS